MPGYAALLAHIAILESGEFNEAQQQAELSSQLRFTEHFSDDPRAVSVMATVAARLFEDQRYAEALDISGSMLDRANLSEEHRQTALLVQGHAAFESQDFLLAEHAYAKLLEPERKLDAKRAEEINQRLAASVYRQAETSVQDNSEQEAIDNFIRVANVAPGSDIGESALFEATTLMLKLEQWPQSIPVLIEFRKQFPESEHQQEINQRLVFAYEQSERWTEAANELELLASSLDEEAAREARYLAASYYQRANDPSSAILAYAEYQQKYPQPFALNIEALATLIELHEQTDQWDKRTHCRKSWYKSNKPR